ncbi:UDP-glucose 4-epimerase [Saccharospirillum sp. MSK14-1]|uniref:NAD-dependent epimerase/dehydratase family protein n=1 Tax=Saccharospirillum sp. MSK14-1 TaxID=1897632 RepID=UPI000D3BF385|nr:NAD-dependent epimerase/dehydratase family protein [Saccharospirillum sp. MSK14-1]PTY38810.1 UDP-glucose 4-epimerase [Saccharospirillum sp. MSK14-1]
MKLLITGGTGMLGQALLRRYHDRFEIAFTGRNRALGHALASETSAQFFPLELTDKSALEQACHTVDAVIHCAALSSPWGSFTAFNQANVQGTDNLLAAAERQQVPRFVHISTPSLYFQFRDALDIHESQTLPKRFCNHYAATKAIAEQAVKRSSLHSVILRPRGIFGPHDNAILPRIIAAVRNGNLWLPSGRNPRVDLTYVDNVADAAILAATREVASESIYNISNGEPVQLLDVLSRLFEQLGEPTRIRPLPYPLLAPVISAAEKLHHYWPGQPEPTLTRYSAALFHFHQTLNIDRARHELGYQPTVSIDEGIQRYVHWRQRSLV